MTGLNEISDDRGRFAVLAIDHRDSLRRFLSPGDPDAVDAAAIVQLKIDLVEGLGDLVSGVMLEPEYSIPQVSERLPEDVGFLAALEAQGYLDDPSAGPTRLLDGWSPEAAVDAGASVAKLLVHYHPDRALAAEQESVAREVLGSCRRAGIPLALEPLFYDLDRPGDRQRVVVETVRRFAAIGPDLLKLPYPGGPAGCSEVGRICADRDVPWAMLSGGGDFDDFRSDLRVALAHGCLGFMVGRALWGEAARATHAERRGVIERVVRPRLETLVQDLPDAS